MRFEVPQIETHPCINGNHVHDEKAAHMHIPVSMPHAGRQVSRFKLERAEALTRTCGESVGHFGVRSAADPRAPTEQSWPPGSTGLRQSALTATRHYGRNRKVKYTISEGYSCNGCSFGNRVEHEDDGEDNEKCRQLEDSQGSTGSLDGETRVRVLAKACIPDLNEKSLWSRERECVT